MVDIIRNPGIRKRFCGNIFKSEMINALSIALRYTSPLQNPIAKLLYHNIIGGIGLKALVIIAEAIIITNVKFDASAAKNVFTAPAELSENPESRRKIDSHCFHMIDWC